MDIVKYHSYFVKNKYDISKTRKLKFKRFKKNTDYDVLFFNLLNNIKHKSIDPFYNKTYEKQVKLTIGQQLDNYKIKQKESIIESLCYDDNITLEVLNILALFFKIDVIFIQDAIFIKMLYSEQELDTYFVVNQNCDVYTQRKEKIDKICEKKFEITNIKKPLNSMSYYKVDDIKQMYTEMNIVYDEKMKKKEAYDFLKSYFESIVTLKY
jgi:hypothetical protein